LQAFERLDQALTKPLIGFLRFTINVPEADAEELASDTLFTVSSHISSFQHGGKAKLTTWIFEIAKNKAIDFHRKPSLDVLTIDDEFPDCGPAGADAGEKHWCPGWESKRERH
jgi:DNA-directed RNA polymerase specialized sigma24 family protein